MSPTERARLRAMIDQYFDVVWRSIRRHGVPPTEMDDCMQQVFLVASRKLSSITAGSEQAFLLGTALRVASNARRGRGRRPEVPEDDAVQAADPSPLPDDLTDQKRLRELLDEVLEAMPMDLRSVFVLFEVEEFSTQEIAGLLGIPTGTAASRLKRAREEFDRLLARHTRGGGPRGSGGSSTRGGVS
ncbi:MAG TPA: sigma-70 family RNA polymerase sigma factor [Polyangiaceae bacterium]|nr:sigma-70 family RNA polymerase sigma factor [Polyangiaceae bacterium]